MVCFSDRAPRADLVLSGAGDDGLAQRRLWLLALSLEPLGHLQAGSGSLCVWAPLKPLHHGHAALGTVPETPPGRLHGLLPSGYTDSDIHSHERLTAVCVGAQGKEQLSALVVQVSLKCIVSIVMKKVGIFRIFVANSK